jgi:hypothetical protein
MYPNCIICCEVHCANMAVVKEQEDVGGRC